MSPSLVCCVVSTDCCVRQKQDCSQQKNQIKVKFRIQPTLEPFRPDHCLNMKQIQRFVKKKSRTGCSLRCCRNWFPWLQVSHYNLHVKLRRQQSSPVQWGKYLVFVSVQLSLKVYSYPRLSLSSLAERVSDLRYLLAVKCYDSPASSNHTLRQFHAD